MSALLLLCSLTWPGQSAWGQAQEALQVQYNLLELSSSLLAQKKMRSPLNVAWRKTPLRQGLENLSRGFGISIWLDRRIDPSQVIDLTSGEEARAAARPTLGSLLDQVAVAADVEIGLVENVIYVAPRGQLARIQCAAVTLHDALSKNAAGNNAKLRPLRWPELTTPAELLSRIAEQWQVELVSDLPHDLMHAGELRAPCTLATQLSILAGGFDRSVEFSGRGTSTTLLRETANAESSRSQSAQLDLRPLSDRTRWTGLYGHDDWNAAKIRRALEATNTQAKFQRTRDRSGQTLWQITGETAAHLGLLELSIKDQASAAAVARVPAEQARWTGEIGGPITVILEQFANSQGLTVEWDSEATERQRMRSVRFKVDNASLDEMLAAFAKSAELQITRRESTIVVQPPSDNP